MSKRLLPTVCLAALALLAATPASSEQAQEGNLRISFSGDFSPRALPRDRPAPISVHVKGEIKTTDGSHPPPARRVEIALNRNGKLTTAGLPSCPGSRLQSTSSETALERCRQALVGRGSFGAEVEFPGVEPFPATGRALAFFGSSGGGRALLVHLYVTAPIETTLVIALRISQRSEGLFRTVLAARIPPLAGGLGSVTGIDLRIGRTYRHRGERRSFLSASCEAPPGFFSGTFPMARGTFFFADGRNIDTTLSSSCRVR